MLPSAEDLAELTPLDYAARHDCLRAVQALLDTDGVLQSLVDNSDSLVRLFGEAAGRKFIMHDQDDPVKLQDREAVVSLILEKVQATGSAMDSVYHSVMLTATRVRRWSIAKLLAQASTSLESRGCKGRTLLCEAVDSGRYGFVKVLLESGAAVNSPDFDGRMPLQVAGQKYGLGAINLLLWYGAEGYNACQDAQRLWQKAYLSLEPL